LTRCHKREVPDWNRADSLRKGGEKQLKKIAVAVLSMSILMMILAVPVMAAPLEDKKVPVKVAFEVTKNTLIENIAINGNMTHRVYLQEWTVNLTIGDSVTPVKGTAQVTRTTDYRYSKPGGVDQILMDDYVFSFPGGGFEGQAAGLITDYVKGPPASYNIKVHALLHGTGAFTGQTINAWQNGPGTTPLWEGYLLKP
jgi:hypothetical protein